ncbi:sensor histidine kinase [Frondihabitans peucedani]|uniref:histidine kinase n=1 Tax=Frondihabitans peucedani TaxID=598626 RepID=A0ABP8E5F3_9MICO
MTDELLLPRPPGLIRRFWLRHALLADILLAAFALLTGYLESIDVGLGLVGADWWVHGLVAFPVIGAAALILRRRRPLLTAGVVIVCSGVLTAFHDGSTLAVALIVAIYSVAVYRGTLQAWIAAAAAFGSYLGLVFVTSAGGVRPSLILVMVLLALLIGIDIGNRRRYLEALVERAAQLARERDAEGRLATAAERSRIAREMHDVVAHSLSVMVRLSDGADAVADTDPERSREAVRQIGQVGRDSLRDMRRLLGVLREDDAPETAPQPTLAELDQLIETYRATGVPVAVQQKGTPPSDPTLQVAVFRAVQESLTNALRYASQPSRVLVQLDYGATLTTVDVTDDGLYLGPSASVGSGRGLVGLRERAAVHGGSVEAGPRIDPETGGARGGWRVHMTLPHPPEDPR